MAHRTQKKQKIQTPEPVRESTYSTDKIKQGKRVGENLENDEFTVKPEEYQRFDFERLESEFEEIEGDEKNSGSALNALNQSKA